MKFKYLTTYGLVDTRGNTVRRPVVEIELLAENGKNIPALGHIDSGADTTTVNIQYAEALGVKIDRTKTKHIIGIGDGQVPVYIAYLRFKIKHMDHEIEVPTWYVDSPNVNILLGQEVFFDIHKIKFEKDHNVFEISCPSK